MNDILKNSNDIMDDSYRSKIMSYELFENDVSLISEAIDSEPSRITSETNDSELSSLIDSYGVKQEECSISLEILATALRHEKTTLSDLLNKFYDSSQGGKNDAVIRPGFKSQVQLGSYVLR